ncbi:MULTISPECIES: acyl-ACP--UDP-N-acetylglucosamine O-acyltransferase [unclassified Prochlorococcus]|uniref:acyl-ACP--UDP-N-acetylglucosamine O-acyltransferase n=1 Tax=unclassified Prochlorococcus TaxID=2627481 RepID=UPI000533B3C4|nr:MULTISPECIES: acyl-ACP--UDP-N-acetylglucosamine O-acyltransferase [unclassified Prochlorococcus]KGG16223.1 Acyl-(acyl-carrier-protein)--UDP-N- acetylglucosamine O-acyltransferase [Prochlorococcus sp. MIT 0603]KGG18043.1 Acyl-(acyl-carrier-protein)--UDP-N- acetylglucosamine O-acyltransferase [Prochlorococcus sp. MIT 0602]
MLEKIESANEMIENSSTKIHPLAVVNSKAELGEGVVVSSGAVIGPEVQIGSNTIIGPNVILDGRLKIGSSNKFFPGACIGLEPQDLKYKGAATEVIIGNNNTFRECVTVNRATNIGEQTRIGDGCLLMAYTHVAHGCDIGNDVVISNSVQIAGEVVIGDKAVIGGLLGIHQFVHIGSLAMVGGMTRVDRDVPPYCLVEGHPGRMRGLNRVGIKRRGLDKQNPEEFKQLQEAWDLIYRSGHIYKKGLELVRAKRLLKATNELCVFLEASIGQGRRGPMPYLNSEKK